MLELVLMATGLTTFEATTPVKLFPTRIFGSGAQATNRQDYNVASDGRFLINQVLEESPCRSR